MVSIKKSLFSILLVLALAGVRAVADDGVSGDESLVERLKLIEYSKQFLGCSYATGATGPKSFDCSGFVFSVSRESIGLQLPRSSRAIYSFSKQIDDAERQPGDLVFFKTTGSGNISHVGIYLGDDQFIHSASDGPSTGIIISSLSRGYWKAHYVGAGQILPKTNAEIALEKPASSN